MATERGTEQASPASHRPLRVAFYAAITLASLGLFGFCVTSFLYTYGDPFVSYNVVNATDTLLLTWIMDRPCEDLVGKKGDYSPVREVPPRERLHYGGSFFQDQCIQVTTIDRRLVHAQDYEWGVEVRVTMPITYLSEPLPPESELGSYRWWEWDGEDLAIIAPLATIPLAAAIAWWTQRRLRRHGIRV